MIHTVRTIAITTFLITNQTIIVSIKGNSNNINPTVRTTRKPIPFIIAFIYSRRMFIIVYLDSVRKYNITSNTPTKNTIKLFVNIVINTRITKGNIKAITSAIIKIAYTIFCSILKIFFILFM